jgi:hypothetical protein
MSLVEVLVQNKDTIQTIGFIFAMVFGLFGFLGGIPEIKKWIKPSPHLKITKLEALHMSEKGATISWTVQNQKMLLKRNSEATDVKLEITDLDGNQMQSDGDPITIRLKKLLMVGAKVSEPYGFSVQVGHFFDGRETSYPYIIMCKASCAEGSSNIKKLIIPAKK